MKIALLFILLSVSSSLSFAAKLNTQCTKNAASGVVEGLNIEKPFTIASVSKVFATHWAIVKLGPQYRHSTRVHVTPLEDDIYDVHLSGVMFPYFDKTMYQYFISELNKLGVNKINYLTYDENFIYASEMRTNALLAHGNDTQTPIEIMRELRRDTTNINVGLAALSAKAKALENVTIPRSLSLTIRDIHHKQRSEYQPSGSTVTYEFKSTELHRILKELNRNSHNYASDLIFGRLMLLEDFGEFITSRLNVPANEFSIYNGSGYPVFINEQKYYNEASCRVIVEMMADLRQEMVKGGLEFKDIMSVAGKDSDADGRSTVSQIYGSDKTNGALIAKTGTVNNTIALAGMVSTENENVFFHTSFGTENTPADRQVAYGKIKDWIINGLIKDKKKSNLDKYIPKTFLPFDRSSALVVSGSSRRRTLR